MREHGHFRVTSCSRGDAQDQNAVSLGLVSLDLGNLLAFADEELERQKLDTLLGGPLKHPLVCMVEQDQVLEVRQLAILLELEDVADGFLGDAQRLHLGAVDHVADALALEELGLDGERHRHD